LKMQKNVSVSIPDLFSAFNIPARLVTYRLK
jgi:hypothetical protein